jgi:hypothetical protein
MMKKKLVKRMSKITWLLLGALLITAGVAGSAGAVSCNFSNSSVQAFCLSVNSTITAQNVTINSLESGQTNLSNSITLLNTSFEGKLRGVVANETNTSVFNATISSDVSSLRTNMTALREILFGNVSLINQANLNASLADKQSSRALDEIGGLSNTTSQSFESTNGNETALAHAVSPLLKLNLTDGNNTFSQGINSNSLLGIVAIVLAIVSIALQFVRGRPKMPAKELAGKAIEGEAQSRANAKSTAGRNSADLAAIKKKKDEEDAKANKELLDAMKKDPQFKKLRLAFKADVDRAAKHKLPIKVDALPSFKALQEKMAEYNQNLEVESDGGNKTTTPTEPT